MKVDEDDAASPYAVLHRRDEKDDQGRPSVMSKFDSRLSRSVSNVRSGFVSNLGNMITISPRGDRRPFPGTGRTAAEALGSDWKKLGGDMRRAVDKVAPGGKR